MTVKAPHVLLATIILVLFAIAGDGPAIAQQQASAAAQCPSIRALDGTCATVPVIDAARRRAAVVSTAQGSYIAAPAGTIGSYFIPYERLFRKDDIRHGLETSAANTTVTFVKPFDVLPACIAPGCTTITTVRSK